MEQSLRSTKERTECQTGVSTNQTSRQDASTCNGSTILTRLRRSLPRVLPEPQNMASDEAVCAVSICVGLLTTLHLYGHHRSRCLGLPGNFTISGTYAVQIAYTLRSCAGQVHVF